jgi:hypothetical protein
MSDDNYLNELWDARLNAFEVFFGPADASVLRSPVPFFMGQEAGGNPNIVSFSRFTDGTLFVTADLVGADHPFNTAGSFEVAMALEGDEEWGVQVLCQLAHYTSEFPIDDGETMDIKSAMPDGATIDGLFFRQIAEFEVMGIEANVICCIGITGPEMAYKQAHGAQALIDKLGEQFFTTDLYRMSVV